MRGLPIKNTTEKSPAKKTAKKGPKKALKKKPVRVQSKMPFWELRLYVAGQTPKSVTAFVNLKRICEEYLQGKYRLDVVDLLEKPQLAMGDQILAIPTLVRRLPEPMKKIIGDLSNVERVLVGLDLRPRS